MPTNIPQTALTVLQARALLETTREAVNKEKHAKGIYTRFNAARKANDEATQDAVMEEADAIETAQGLWEVHDILREAEDALIDWAVDHAAKALPNHPQWAEIRAALPKMRQLPYRTKLVELCLRLKA